MVMPLLMGATMLLMTRNMLSLIFILLSPLIMIGNWADQRIRRKRELKHDIKVFIQGVEDADRRLTRTHAAERRARKAQYPAVNEVVDQALALGRCSGHGARNILSSSSCVWGWGRICHAPRSRRTRTETAWRSITSPWTSYGSATPRSATSPSSSTCVRTGH